MLKQDFIQNIRLLLREEYETFEAALDNEPPVSLRINPRKLGTNVPPQQTGTHPIAEKIPWCYTGYYLPERPSFTFDPLFHAGVYYVQEAASMFLEQAILKTGVTPAFAQKQITALDLCAAPGGKSTHLLTLLPENSLLVCNEVIRSRSLILAENTAKWGYANTVITQSDPQQFGRIPHFFDVILADLPCSGEGMFRKEPDTRDKWSLEQVKHCAARQRRIVHDVWNALKPGGFLIYSTCTFNTQENEDNVKTLSEELEAEIIPVPVHPEWNITGALRHDIPAYRFFPHRTRGEGFFLALIQKTGSPQETGRKSRPETKTNRQNNKQPPTLPDSLKNLLSEPEKFAYRNTRYTNGIYAIPKTHEHNCTVLSECLNIISAGLLLGEWKGKDFIPAASLALSTEINIDTFPMVDLTYEQAISYLQREAVAVPANTPKGTILVTYRRFPLGFVKNTGERTNNLFPKEWRIRSRTGNGHFDLLNHIST